MNEAAQGEAKSAALTKKAVATSAEAVITATTAVARVASEPAGDPSRQAGVEVDNMIFELRGTKRSQVERSQQYKTTLLLV